MTLSPEEVALLATFEKDEELPPVTFCDDYTRALASITPSNPIAFNQNGAAVCVVWSLFMSWMSRWADTGRWSFTDTHVTVEHNGVTNIIPITNQPDLPLIEAHESTNPKPH